MGWTHLPAAMGDEVTAAQTDDLREAMIERRRAVGLSSTDGCGDPPDVPPGAVCYVSTMNAYRQGVEELLGHYVRTDDSGEAWSKGAILEAAFGAGRADWTRVPPRGGTPAYEAILYPGDVMYVEHVNELKEVIDLLYLVPLEEKEGREYASRDVAGWTWGETGGDPLNTFVAVGNHQTGDWGEEAESAPYDLKYAPIGAITIVTVKMRGTLIGTDEDRTVKFINFVNGSGAQPSDREWNAEVRLSDDRPADSPRGADTTVVYENNLADDDTHTADSKNDDFNLLEVYITDEWGPEVLSGLPDRSHWPFWLTTVVEDFGAVIAAYALEAQASGRDLQIWWGKAAFNVTKVWAELDFERQD